jgi:uracil-DNA glycosylase
MSAEPTSLLRYTPMTLADLKSVIEIENSVYVHPWTMGNFRDSIQAGHRCVLLTYGDAIIGYSVVLIAADEAHLLNLTIASGWQNKGHGRTLLLHMTSIAVTEFASNFFLEVRPSNPNARALYESAQLLSGTSRARRRNCDGAQAVNHSEAYLKEMGLWPIYRHKSAPRADVAVVNIPSISSAQKSDASDRRSAVQQMDWAELKSTVKECRACPLRGGCTQTVFGVGDENADWLFVGEGPGAEEDQRGEPFVGQAGRLLDNMLAALDLKRGNNVYIANVVKCRPPGNRNPEADEAAACQPYLARQIELIQPKLIVALGKVAAANLLSTDAPIGALRGKVHHYRDIPLIATYHPAYLLRTLPDKAKAWADLVLARRTISQ